MDSDNRFYVQRFIGGRLTGTVSGAAYYRATQHADECIRAGYADRVVVRGYMAEATQGHDLSPVLYSVQA